MKVLVSILAFAFFAAHGIDASARPPAQRSCFEAAVIQTGFKHGLHFPPPVPQAMPKSLADLTRLPSISFSARAFVEPYVNVDATGSASLSLGIGSAGGRITVRVLGLAVPAGMEASVNTADLKLRMQETADLKLATLKGKVEAFATLGFDPFSTSWYWTLFDWDGYERTIPIFHRTEAPVDLSKVMKRLAGPTQVSFRDLD